MGIKGLLKVLSPIQKHVHISQFKGETVAVDAYVWLHRGAYSCAWELNLGIPTKAYVNFVVNRCRMFRNYGVEPYIVFDGCRLPLKSETNAHRRDLRETAVAQARKHLQEGNPEEARKMFSRAISITPEMCYSLMQALKEEQIKFIVAPYEADAQMAYLEKNGFVSLIVSEDSDLFVFGASKLLTKMDNEGNGLLIDRADFSSVSRLPRLSSFTPAQFRLWAILSGCDYTKGVFNVGLARAYNIAIRSPSVNNIVGLELPNDLLKEIVRADITFQYQRVVDPSSGELCHLNPLEIELDDEMNHYIGPEIHSDVISSIASGLLDPTTLEP
ncbi:hypothetical protein CANCADRAFT_17583, partial [Tortispora caseinolytica NRRL Y-17796]